MCAGKNARRQFRDTPNQDGNGRRGWVSAPLDPTPESCDWRSLYEQERARAEAEEARCEELTRTEREARAREGQLQRLLEKSRQQAQAVVAELRESAVPPKRY